MQKVAPSNTFRVSIFELKLLLTSFWCVFVFKNGGTFDFSPSSEYSLPCSETSIISSNDVRTIYPIDVISFWIFLKKNSQLIEKETITGIKKKCERIQLAISLVLFLCCNWGDKCFATFNEKKIILLFIGTRSFLLINFVFHFLIPMFFCVRNKLTNRYGDGHWFTFFKFLDFIWFEFDFVIRGRWRGSNSGCKWQNN